MGKWADYLISAVKYDADRRIIQVRQHPDSEEIRDGELIDRQTLATNMKKGTTYCTIFISSSTWKRGDPINLIKAEGDYSIRTDSNKVKYDNLKFVTELE